MKARYQSLFRMTCFTDYEPQFAAVPDPSARSRREFTAEMPEAFQGVAAAHLN